jgi:Domain of unknown function (DUF6894)
MPQYAFHVQIADQLIKDFDRDSFEDDTSAARHAEQLARNLTTGSTLEWRNCFLKVTDASGALLFQVPFALARQEV